MHYNGVPKMPHAGPIATEAAAAVVRELTNGDHPIPVIPTAPVPTYPGRAPHGTEEATPQPVYPVSNPNSTLGMSPALYKFAQFGFAGLAALGILWLGRNLIDSSNADRKVIVDEFQQLRKDSREDTRELNKAMLATMREISENLARVSRSQERLEAKFKED